MADKITKEKSHAIELFQEMVNLFWSDSGPTYINVFVFSPTVVYVWIDWQGAMKILQATFSWPNLKFNLECAVVALPFIMWKAHINIKERDRKEIDRLEAEREEYAKEIATAIDAIGNLMRDGQMVKKADIEGWLSNCRSVLRTALTPTHYFYRVFNGEVSDSESMLRFNTLRFQNNFLPPKGDLSDTEREGIAYKLIVLDKIIQTLIPHSMKYKVKNTP